MLCRSRDTPDFDELQSLAVIQDADKDPSSAFKRICSVLSNNKMKPPKRQGVFTDDTPRIGVFTIPDGKNTGKLESLCLSTVQSEPVMECIEPFMKCVEQKSQSGKGKYKSPKDPHKARCRAFLSAMEEDIPSLGIAAQKKYWNLDSEKLHPLIQFLKRL